MHVDVKYKRIHDLRNDQLDNSPITRKATTFAAAVIFMMVIGLIIWANAIGVQRAYGMEAYTVMRVMEIKGEEVVLFSDDGIKFLVPVPSLDVKPLQEVLVVFHIKRGEDGNWITLPEKGMYIEHILD